jgi:hypothetical protein
MADRSSELERQRLAEYYARQPDGELEKLADEWDELSQVAREALSTELVRRGYELDLEPKPRDPGPQLEKLVAIRVYRDLAEADLVKGLLGTAGIDSHLRDDNMVRMSWLYSNWIGGVKLLVREEDVEAAENVLRHPLPESFTVEGFGDYEQPRCPRCGSLEIRYQDLNKPVAYVSMWLLVPILLPDRKWICDACGVQWQEKPDPPNA